MSVKFWKMKFDGRKYKDKKNGFVWELDGTKDNFYAYIAGMGFSLLTLYYSHKQLVDMEFEEVIDWAKIPIDTKIIVWNNGDKQKEKRHFAGINGVGWLRLGMMGKRALQLTEPRLGNMQSFIKRRVRNDSIDVRACKKGYNRNRRDYGGKSSPA